MLVVHEGFTANDVISFQDQWLCETLCFSLSAVTPLSRSGGLSRWWDALLSCVCDSEPQLQQHFCEGFGRIFIHSIECN